MLQEDSNKAVFFAFNSGVRPDGLRRDASLYLLADSRVRGVLHHLLELPLDGVLHRL